MIAWDRTVTLRRLWTETPPPRAKKTNLHPVTVSLFWREGSFNVATSYIWLLTLWSRSGSSALACRCDAAGSNLNKAACVVIFFRRCKSGVWTCFECTRIPNTLNHQGLVPPPQFEGTQGGNRGGKAKMDSCWGRKFKPSLFPRARPRGKMDRNRESCISKSQICSFCFVLFCFLSWSWRQDMFSRNTFQFQ